MSGQLQRQERVSRTHLMYRLGPRAGLDTVEREKFLLPFGGEKNPDFCFRPVFNPLAY
jgi:hypothetical protein